MSRIQIVDIEKGTDEQKELLNAVKSKMGKVPNIYAGMAQSAPALRAYMSFTEHLQHGQLDPKTRETIALAVSQYNKCDYCLSAHVFVGSKKLGMTEEQIEAIRNGKSSNQKIQELLNFVNNIVDARGNIDDKDYQQIRAAGYSEAEVVEIIANIIQTTFTNYFNHVAQTEIDFPRVNATELKQVA